MRAVLKDLNIFDTDMNSLVPEDSQNFAGIVEAEIGPDDRAGSERFSAMVCTPIWFAENVLTLKKQDLTHETFYETAFGTHYLFVLEYDAATIRQTIERLINIDGHGEWSKAAKRLSRHMAWEYDDYDPSDK